MPQTMYALLLNPRSGEFRYSDINRREVAIRDLDDRTMGTGAFDNNSSAYGWTHGATGFPRVHVPDGVKHRGRGDGTVLYTALCAAAKRSSDGDLGRDGPPAAQEGAGISSGAPRSSSAEAWWSAAKDTYGLVKVVSSTRESDFELELTEGYRRHAVEIATEALSASRVVVDSYSMGIRGRAKINAEADAYPFDAAIRRGLVAAWVGDVFVDLAWSELDAARNLEVLSLKSILAGNFGALGVLHRVLSASRRDHPSELDVGRGAQILLDAAKDAGASSADLDRCRLRFITGIDDDPRAWSEIGDYSAFLPSRDNPKAQRRANSRQEVPTAAFARPAAVRAASAHVVGLRRDLGWDAFRSAL